MAQPPSSNTAEVPAPARSHGRGGAGNINSKPSTKLNHTDLQTPTLKSSTYTTGRGGSGNMAVNNPNDPAESRAAQDVDAPSHHAKDMQGTYHWGRGGEGNMTTLGKSGAQQARDKSKERKASKEREKKERTLSKGSADGDKRRGSFREGLIGKAKEMVGLNKKNSNANGTMSENESAVE